MIHVNEVVGEPRTIALPQARSHVFLLALRRPGRHFDHDPATWLERIVNPREKRQGKRHVLEHVNERDSAVAPTRKYQLVNVYRVDRKPSARRCKGGRARIELDAFGFPSRSPR